MPGRLLFLTAPFFAVAGVAPLESGDYLIYLHVSSKLFYVDKK